MSTGQSSQVVFQLYESKRDKGCSSEVGFGPKHCDRCGDETEWDIDESQVVDDEKEGKKALAWYECKECGFVKEANVSVLLDDYFN